MNKQDLVVQLFAPTRGKRGRIGTAYPVAENVLMTAAHVVGDATGEKIEARWWHQNGADGEWKLCEAILWDGRKQVEPCDVVLLKCPFPAAMTGRWGRLAAIPPEDFKKWTGVGFPLVGERGQDPVPLKGECFSAASFEHNFSLEIDAPTDVDENWCGASGSPVFVEDAIVGVVVEVPRNFRAGRFHAIPVQHLVKHDEFCTHAGYRKVDDRRSQLVAAAKDALSKSNPAMVALTEQLDVAFAAEGLNLAAAIIEKLLELQDAVTLGDVVVQAQQRFSLTAPESAGAVNCLSDLAMLLFPVKLGSDHVHQIHVVADVNSNRYDFHASTETLAELAIARYHGRPATFRPPESQRDVPRPKFRLEKPVVAAIDPGGETFKKEFVKELLNRLSLAGVPESICPVTVNRINAELNLRKRERRAIHYYIFSLSDNSDNREVVLQTIGELRKLFPLVAFICLASPDGTVEEFECVQLLLRIMRRAAGYEWEIDSDG